VIILEDWQAHHGEIIREFVSDLNKTLNKNSNEFILKGGTALMLCYGLDRFSEDIDLDKNKGSGNLLKYVGVYCKQFGYEYRVAKDTSTVKRALINYGGGYKPLKVEMSMRRKEIPTEEIATVSGITTYTTDTLAEMKALAYQGRDAIRDLYDLCYLYNHYKDQITPRTVSMIQRSLSYKGLEQFDYLIHTQEDELIDNEKLMNDFLNMYDSLGLLYDEDEKKLVDEMTKSTANKL